MAKIKKDNASAAAPAAPSASIIFVTYSFLGALLSFGFGRDPSPETLLPDADAIAEEVAPTIIIICLFLVSYSLLDVMHVGVVKAEHGWGSKPYPSVAGGAPPEEVYLAQRVQTNQVEQLPGFLVGSTSFTLLVDGKVGAALSLTWAVLRRMYASRYRSSVGKTIEMSGITTFTIPAYFALNAMLMGAAVQCTRILVRSWGR